MIEALRGTVTHLFRASKHDRRTVIALLEKDKQHRKAGEACALMLAQAVDV